MATPVVNKTAARGTAARRLASRYLAHDTASAGWAFKRTKDNVVQWRDGHPFYWDGMLGQGFRVYDVVSVNGFIHRVSYESPRATHRVFVEVVGHQWRYMFGENEMRTITAHDLARQRTTAQFHAGKHQHGSSTGMTTPSFGRGR